MIELKKPLLAVAVEDTSKIKYPCYASVKIDGLRCLIKDGVAYSRSMKPIPSRAVQDLFGKPEYNGFDGELIYGDMLDPLVFNKTTSFCMSKEVPDGMDKEFISYRVFDRWDLDLPWIERIKSIQDNDWLLNPHTQVWKLRHHLIENESQLLDLEDVLLSNGAEGLMVRDSNGKYKQGRSTLREGILLKLKRFNSAECIVTGFEELMHNANEAKVNETGHTDRSSHKENLVPMNTLGALLVKDMKSCVDFAIGTGYTAAQRKEIWDNREQWLGKIVTYTHFAVGSGYDKPRFPVFKDCKFHGERAEFDMSN
ncbi:DNA ligase [compost metagenome]